MSYSGYIFIFREYQYGVNLVEVHWTKKPSMPAHVHQNHYQHYQQEWDAEWDMIAYYLLSWLIKTNFRITTWHIKKDGLIEITCIKHHLSVSYLDLIQTAHLQARTLHHPHAAESLHPASIPLSFECVSWFKWINLSFFF